jgi:hypothetical protein
VVRDPWERFCSGYWERATTPLRASKAVLARQKGYHVWGYPKYHPMEKEIFEKYLTPNDYITHIRENGETVFPPNIHLEDMINPLTKWLGRLPKYLTYEHRVMMAVDIEALGLVIQELTGHELPRDPFRARRRDLFNIQQSYEISQENLQWFRDVYRRDDYELIEHIRQQPYYRSVP